MFKKIVTTGAVAAVSVLMLAGGSSAAMAVDENLVVNGGFDGPGYTDNSGLFPAGAAFDGWTLEYEGDWHINVLKIWHPGMGEPGVTNHAPFESGPWARLVGNINQTFATEVGKTYLLEYDTRATSFGPSTGPGFDGGSPADVRINGDVVDSFVTVGDPVISPRSVSFTATSESTTLSFVTTGVHVGSDGVGDGAVSVGLDNISVTEVPIDDSPLMVPAIAGGIGVAALAGGSAFALNRKNKRSSK